MTGRKTYSICLPSSNREVQQLRPDVRGSLEIGFAVKAFSALNANNYVRFFRLVKSASFLNACILHRYFNQIRARALQIILRSHTAGQKQVTVSVVWVWVCVCVVCVHMHVSVRCVCVVCVHMHVSVRVHVCVCVSHPDMTFAVDWALNNNYLSI